MRLAFIDLGVKLSEFFVGASEYLPPTVDAVFYSQKPKAKSLLLRCRQDVSSPVRPGGAAPVASKAMIDEVGAKHRLLGFDQEAISCRVNKVLPGLIRFFEEKSPDAIFVWNGSGTTASAAKHLARGAGIPVLHGENGYLPFTMQIDLRGVNYDSSISKRIRSDLGIPIGTPERQREAAAFLRQFRSRQMPPYEKRRHLPGPSLRSYIEDAIVNAKRPRRRNQFNRRIPRRIELTQPYVLLPLQVIGDSQLLFHSPIVGRDLPRLVRCAAAALKRVAPDHRLVVKLHPQDAEYTDYDPLAQELPDIGFVCGMDIREMLESAAAVITVNSTVGFESLLFQKPVLAVGRNFYTIPELTRTIQNLADLDDGLRATLAATVPYEMALRLCDLSRHEYFAAGSWRDHHPRSYKAVADKIALELAAGRPQGEATPPAAELLR